MDAQRLLRSGEINIGGRELPQLALGEGATQIRPGQRGLLIDAGRQAHARDEEVGAGHGGLRHPVAQTQMGKSEGVGRGRVVGFQTQRFLEGDDRPFQIAVGV